MFVRLFVCLFAFSSHKVPICKIAQIAQLIFARRIFLLYAN